MSFEGMFNIKADSLLDTGDKTNVNYLMPQYTKTSFQVILWNHFYFYISKV